MSNGKGRTTCSDVLRRRTVQVPDAISSQKQSRAGGISRKQNKTGGETTKSTSIAPEGGGRKGSPDVWASPFHPASPLPFFPPADHVSSPHAMRCIMPTRPPLPPSPPSSRPPNSPCRKTKRNATDASSARAERERRRRKPRCPGSQVGEEEKMVVCRSSGVFVCAIEKRRACAGERRRKNARRITHQKKESGCVARQSMCKKSKEACVQCPDRRIRARRRVVIGTAANPAARRHRSGSPSPACSPADRRWIACRIAAAPGSGSAGTCCGSCR